MLTKIRDPVLDQICPALPPRVREAVRALSVADRQSLLEIRLRRGRPAMGVTAEGDLYLCCAGQPVDCTEDEWAAAVRLVTQCSVYALERELSAGFITLPGGHRVGLVGRAVLDGETVRTQTELSSMNYRVAREMPGVADRLMPYVLSADRTRVLNILILSGPGLGKTTLLRDIARQLSTGLEWGSERGSQSEPCRGAGAPTGFRVGIVDERSEIAACSQGVPQNQLGPRADVIDGCPKAAGIMMMIRSMSPDVVVTDEVGRDRDANALEEASRCGVAVIATAHALDPEDAARRPVLREVLARGAFDRAVVLGRSLGLGTCERIVNLRSDQDLSARPFRLECSARIEGVRR
ncbi:MAG TPA: stage III sporulation protein AA [Bacillota bacterium]|nr:stage III sporulation protein AA [Bacillota bacterium]